MILTKTYTKEVPFNIKEVENVLDGLGYIADVNELLSSHLSFLNKKEVEENYSEILAKIYNHNSEALKTELYFALNPLLSEFNFSKEEIIDLINDNWEFLNE